uniref:Protein polybromo-1 n=1 Tax=Panagrolaimus superbus TaxID=310955 RepID=A0A914YR62_9BILA
MRTPRRRLKREETYDQVDMCQKLYDALKAAKDSDGKYITDPFTRVPSRRTDVEYYNVITDPIDFARINQRLRAYEYNSFSDFCKDIELIISNAHLYYKEDSPEYLSATLLQKVYQELKTEHENPSESVETSPSPNFGEKGITSPAGIPDGTKLEHILTLILGKTDKQGRLLSPPFRVLATEDELPEYYDVVKNPIDFKTIATKIRSGRYKSWAAFDEDIQLLVNNCKLFNSSTSQLYKDAVKINTFYEEKKGEILAPKFIIDKSKIIENKRIINALLEQKESNDNSELSEDSEEDEGFEENMSNPLWLLYWEVRNLPNEKKNQPNIADPFLELPNKQHYPDYYDEISNPMSLYVINKRLKSGYYNSLQYLVDDLLLICYNARCYNMESSEFYLAACKLEKFISKKARELDPTVSINIAEVPNEEDEEMGEEEDDEEEDEEEEKPKVERKKRAHVSIAESDNNDSETSFIRPPSHKRRKKSEFTEFGSEIGKQNMVVRKHPQGRKSIEEHQHIYRNKLYRVLNTVKNYNLNGRLISEPLLFVPDPKQFPDYYAKVKKPIDLTTIEKNVETLTYKSSAEFMNDLFTLFNNVRLLYPANTEIVQHANILQENAAATMKHITKGQVIPLPKKKERSSHYKSRRSYGSPGTPSRTPGRASAAAFTSPAPESRRTVVQPQRNVAEEQAKMKEIYNSIFGFRGNDKRPLAGTFVKLPTRDEYPSYYEKIKRPIDLSKVSTKINANNYESLKDFFADLKLVFDNACLFNDPTSQIYKDALILQKEILQLRNQYLNEEICISSEVKLLLMKIFVAVSTFASNGRCLSESLDDIQRFLRKSGVSENEMPFSLDEIKYNLDKGRYRRLDRFQEDFFYLLSKIREFAPLTSDLFRDTIELQKHFIDKRDILIKDILITPGKLYSRSELEKELEIVRKRRKQKDQGVSSETMEPEVSREPASQDVDVLNNSAEASDEAMASIDFDGKAYYPEDYVYVASADDNAPPDAPKHIMRIERIFHDEEGTLVVRGIWCYKPCETYHLATRLFFPNEVFLTPFKDSVTVERLRGKCCVMFAEDYLKSNPIEFDDDNVYVCESKYLGRKQHFKKLQTWPYPEEIEKLKVEKRSEPLKVVKVKSELARDGSEMDINEEKKKARSESTQPKESEENIHESITGVVSERVKNLPRILDIHRDEVKDSKNPSNENATYYEQMLHNGTWYRRGDGVLTFREKAGHCDVFRIDKMWRNKDGEDFISGPYFARPHEVKHDINVTFFKRELIAVEQPDSVMNMNLIQARCVILTTKIYETSRPTEFAECDVFLVDRRVWGETPISDWKQCSLVGGTYEPSISSGFPLDLNDSRPIKKLKVSQI